MAAWRERLGGEKGWAFKCLAINGCGSAIDYSVLLLLGAALALPTPVATMSGLALGASFNFIMNRRYVFPDSPVPLAAQALRYGSAMLGLMTIHAVVVWFLRERVGIPLVPAKLLGDVGVLGLSQPFILRKFVFPRTPRPAPVVLAPASATVTA